LLFLADSLLPAGASHLFGDWCLADTELALMLNRLVMHGDPVPDRLAKYAGAQWQRQSVQAWMAMERRNE
jgi:glutathione S-transferase